MGPPNLTALLELVGFTMSLSGESSRLEGIAVLVQSNFGIFDIYRSALNLIKLSQNQYHPPLFIWSKHLLFINLKTFLDAYVVGPVVFSRELQNETPFLGVRKVLFLISTTYFGYPKNNMLSNSSISWNDSFVNFFYTIRYLSCLLFGQMTKVAQWYFFTSEAEYKFAIQI